MDTTGTRAARVVVGYDASTSAQAAVGWAAEEAAHRALPLTVVYAADYTGLVGGPISMSPALPGVSVDEAKRVAQRGADLARTRRPGLAVDTATFAGSPSTVLIKESRAAATLVVGTRGHGDVAGVLLGSVASRVAAHAQCPVVVVRGEDVVVAGPGRPVVVGVDGSPSAAAALEAAIGRATDTGATLRIVCAWRPNAPGDWEREYWLAVDPGADPEETARDAAERVVADATAAVQRQAPELTVETSVRGGDAAAVVLAAAGDAGLVVVGARGRGSLASLLLGSVSHGVVHGARCPVMILRAPSSEQVEGETPRSSEAGDWRPVGLL